MAAIAWLSWSTESFARARAQRRPVLLSITTSWCCHSHDMDCTSYADSGVAEIVSSRYVPIRVDADRRPDIAERYGLGGWPTTAFLTSEGEMLGGGTYVEVNRLTDVLQRVYEAFAAGRHARAASPGMTRNPASAATIDQLVEQVVRSFDAVNGGFGSRPKFPHTSPVRLALDLYKESESEQFREIAIRSLDAIGWGPLHDQRDGGFFRCSQADDWQQPSREKLLEVNASLLSLYLEAFEALGLARYAERAEDILRYVQAWLADPVDGGWAGSQPASPELVTSVTPGHAEAGEPRTTHREPRTVDRTLYADWNGMMVSAALQAGRLLNDAALSEFAIRSLEHLVLLCYRPGAGTAHYFDGGAHVRGLLDDQIAMAVAHLDAFDATGNVVYEMMAQELALYAIHTMWDRGEGGFFDRVAGEDGDIGLMNEVHKPFVTNCLAATMLRRLAQTSGKTDFAGYAEGTLAAMARYAAAEGPLAAEYVLAVRYTSRPDLEAGHGSTWSPGAVRS